jgi:hypothetical protein
MTSFPETRSAPINVFALGVATSVTLVVLFALCWIVALALPSLGLSHGWINLYTTAPVSSVRALIEGIVWSVVFGWIIAAVLGATYNKLA